MSQIELDEGDRMMNLCSVGQWSFLLDDRNILFWVERSLETFHYTVRGHCNCCSANRLACSDGNVDFGIL